VRLSLNFTLAELVRSQTARTRRISNDPSPEELENLRALAVEVLQPLRDQFGPIRVTSGFRSWTPGSAHYDGFAADMQPLRKSVTVGQMVQWLRDSGIPTDQIIHEHRTDEDGGSTVWLHVGHRRPSTKEKRGQVLSAVLEPGQKTQYFAHAPEDPRFA
jgi:hypothetical protein